MKVWDGLRRRAGGGAVDCAGAGQMDAADYRWIPGTGNRMRWFFSGVWLVYLIAPISGLFGPHHGALWVAGGVAIVAVFCVFYLAVICAWGRNTERAQQGLAVLFALAVLACVIYGKDWTSLWIYVSVATGVTIPGRRAAMLAVLVVGACYALLSWLAHVGTAEFLIVLVPTVLAGWAMTGFRMQIALIQELSQARETVERLAANEERLRLARDLHDLTGHSLSLVTLKAELVQRMLDRLPASPERDRAARDVADIERVSRETLHDIRQAVSGYRRRTLAVELAAARSALDAAGIRLDASPGQPQRTGPLGEEREAALAWCLREAVTNVIRHSGAGSCQIRLLEDGGELSLEVADDGRGVSGPGGGPGGGPGAQAGGPAGTTAPPAGSGLHGMSERLSAAGGRLSAGPAQVAGESGRGFRLVATVPVPPQPDGPGTDGAPPPGRAIANVTP